MKTKMPNLLATSTALVLVSLNYTFAQSAWQTVDVLSPWQGRSIVADSAGNFISIAIDDQGGSAATAPLSTAVSLSSDHGATWQIVGYAPGHEGHLAVAPDGTLFSTGTRIDSTTLRAFVLQSIDHGATWTTVTDPWAGQTTTFMSMSIAAGNSGAIYLGGWINGGNRWVVRKGLPGPTGFTWSTVDNYAATCCGSQPDQVLVRPGSAPGQPDELLVCGNVNGAWTIRHSLDSGATWTTIESYSTGRNVGGSGVAMAPDGSIYFVLPTATTTTVGSKKTGYTTTTVYGWLVRKSTNGGASWTNVDSFTNADPGFGSVAVDPFGRVFVAGIGNYGTSLPQTWVVRGTSDGGATWITTDFFLPAGYSSSQAWAVASDALGNVCVLGVAGNGSTATDVAPIRRLAAQ